MNPKLTEFIDALRAAFPGCDTVYRAGVDQVFEETRNSKGRTLFCTSPEFKVSRGVYRIPKADEEISVTPPATQVSATAGAEMVLTMKSPTPVIDKSMIPTPDNSFVPFGDFKLLLNFIKSKNFYPIFISGESGNGKTKMVYEACANSRRELIRANITETTDEDDLIGGFRLVNGETAWHNGPVIEALERGAILLLDEIDLASNKILCLQSVLEGKGVFLKKIGRFVKPAAGFNVFATANTKGKGSEDGRFIGTNVLNEAFLERFPVTFEQAYPTPKVETAILKKAAEALGGDEEEFHRHVPGSCVGVAIVQLAGVAFGKVDNVLHGFVGCRWLDHQHIGAGVDLREVDEVRDRVVLEVGVKPMGDRILANACLNQGIAIGR